MGLLSGGGAGDRQNLAVPSSCAIPGRPRRKLRRAPATPHDPLAVNIRHRLAPPAWMDGGTRAHLLGTDQGSRDVLSRIVYGGRVSLAVGVGAVLVSATIGVALGLAAGYFGGGPTGRP
jgi:ABC-type dipeptide/oligopeptide/nickel transport system permease subunit